MEEIAVDCDFLNFRFPQMIDVVQAVVPLIFEGPCGPVGRKANSYPASSNAKTAYLSIYPWYKAHVDASLGLHGRRREEGPQI